MNNYSDMEQAQEAGNMAACAEAFIQAHPGEPVEFAEDCDAGSWSCPNCPWRETASHHNSHLTIQDCK